MSAVLRFVPFRVCVFVVHFNINSTKMDMDSDLSEYLSDFYGDILRAEANLQYFAHAVSTPIHGHAFIFSRCMLLIYHNGADYYCFPLFSP